MSTGPDEVLVLRERHGHVELLTLHRPEALNALNPELLDELDTVIGELEEDRALQAVVLTGSGKAFVAGADIARMKDLSAVEAETFAGRGQRILDRLSRLPVPVIAAVNGFALGGGCELAMCCDLIFAGPAAKFGQPEVRLGVIPGFGGTQRLTRRVGLSVALDLCLTGRTIGAEEAVAVGLASRRIEGDVVKAALEAAEAITRLGPVAVRLAKRAVHEAADADLSVGLAAERTLFGLCFATADQGEGMAAFLEKRTPRFTGV